MKESTIQMQIIEYLSLIAQRYNFLFFSVPNEGVMKALKMFKVPDHLCARIINWFKKMGLTSGVLDIEIIHNNKPYFLEVKAEKGVLSKNEKIFIERLEKQGIKYEIVRSVQAVENTLWKWGVIE